jgi:hypothetical protein
VLDYTKHHQDYGRLNVCIVLQVDLISNVRLSIGKSFKNEATVEGTVITHPNGTVQLIAPCQHTEKIVMVRFAICRLSIF